MNRNAAARLSGDEVWQLVECVKNGDTAAFEPIYQRYERQVFLYLFQLTGERVVAEDLAADVFLRVFKSINGYSYQGRDFVAVLYRIARNCAMDFFKSAAYRRTVSFDPLEHDDASHEETDASVLRAWAKERVWGELLEGLTEFQRHCVLFYYKEGMDIKEIAALMQVSESAVKTRLVAARSKLLRTPLAYELRSCFPA